MAIKPDFNVLEWELGYYLNETADKGLVVCISTASSGTDLDGSANLATVKANPSGAYPIGVLVDQVVNIDTTQYVTNVHKPEINIGNKVSIVKKGWLVTDKVHAEQTVTAGKTAVLYASGLVGDAVTGWEPQHVNNPYVGRFNSGKDENGFCRLSVDL